MAQAAASVHFRPPAAVSASPLSPHETADAWPTVQPALDVGVAWIYDKQKGVKRQISYIISI